MLFSNRLLKWLALFALIFSISAPQQLLADEEGSWIDETIDKAMKPVAENAEAVIFKSVPIGDNDMPIVLILLGGTAIFLTVWFGFINLRAFGLALKTVRGKLTDPNAPGQITHFQALTTALSATVGLGNIAGVAVAIGLGGPGATFWMILMGLLGMTTKFSECTLGVKYRKIDEQGRVHGGAMYYLSEGFKERGLAPIGLVLAFLFAIMCLGGTFGAGNMFQVNQAGAQIRDTFGLFENQKWVFGAILAVMVGAVIIGGIVSIAKVTSLLVPFMCIFYIVAALVIILGNIGEVPAAFATIFKSAFSAEAVGGGIVGVLIQGIKRAAFSNEAGLGSAPIAHSAVKTDKPASEGLVAMLEPFTDTVVVCTMTALVIVITGLWQVNGNVEQPDPVAIYAEASASSEQLASFEQGAKFDIIEKSEKEDWFKVEEFKGEKAGWVAAADVQLREGWSGGVWLTSQAFGSKISWFPAVLAIAVFLFAFSTMISWSYYGEQAVIYMFGRSQPVIIGYKIIFCLMAIVGSAASLEYVLRLSDAMVFAMVFPNLIGLYFLLPVVRKELNSFIAHAKEQKNKD